MGKIIAVVSGKGGTGKTSFTANVGLALAALGCHTLCLDCDITLRNLDLALGLSDRALMDFTDVIAGRCTLEDAVVQHPKYPKLHLLTAPLSARPVPIAPEQMKALLDRIRQTYDYCLIDAPAGWGWVSIWPATTPTGRWWSPTPTPPPCGTPSAPSWSWTVWDGQPSSGGGPGGEEAAAKPSHHHRRRHGQRGSAAAGRGTGGPERPLCLNTGIPLRECSNYAARAYENIARRIMGQRIPLMRI